MIHSGTIFNKRWTIDKKLGEGGCASVYSLIEEDNNIGKLVIKLAKLPTGKTKADKEQLKIANTLNYERMLYMGILKGFKYCVKLPTQYFYGEEFNYRYLIMARLDYDLKYLATCNTTTTPSISTIVLLGNQILEGLEILHSKGYLFVDVKPDNFMIKKNHRHRSNDNEFTLHDELFFIDFGLAEKFTQYISAGSQRERTQGNGVAGTPSYASLDVLSGYSPCRKDDLEALGYVLLSLFLGGRLPWSDVRSDVECLRIKRDTDINALSRRLGCHQLGEFITFTRQMDPQSVPDYNHLRGLINQLESNNHSSNTNSKTTGKSSRVSKRSLSPVPHPPNSNSAPFQDDNEQTSNSSKRKISKNHSTTHTIDNNENNNSNNDNNDDDNNNNSTIVPESKRRCGSQRNVVSSSISTTEQTTKKQVNVERKKGKKENSPRNKKIVEEITDNSNNDDNDDDDKDDDDDEEEEGKGNTPVKVKSSTKISSTKNENWRERVVPQTNQSSETLSTKISSIDITTNATTTKNKSKKSSTIDLTDEVEIETHDNKNKKEQQQPQKKEEQQKEEEVEEPVVTQKRKTRSKTTVATLPNDLNEPSKIVLTVTRCGGHKQYVGHRVTMNIPKIFPKNKKLSKKSADNILFLIGADKEECDFSFENDGYMSSKHAQIKIERFDSDSLHNCIVHIKDLRSTNGTRVNGEEISMRWEQISDGDKIELGNTEFIVRFEN